MLSNSIEGCREIVHERKSRQSMWQTSLLPPPQPVSSEEIRLAEGSGDA